MSMEKITISFDVELRYAHQALERLEVLLKGLGAAKVADAKNPAKAAKQHTEPTSRARAKQVVHGNDLSIDGTILEVDGTYKTGKKRNGETWAIGLISIDTGDEWPTKATTFDDDLREQLSGMSVGDRVQINIERQEKGNKLLGLTLLAGGQTFGDDDIPF